MSFGESAPVVPQWQKFRQFVTMLRFLLRPEGILMVTKEKSRPSIHLLMISLPAVIHALQSFISRDTITIQYINDEKEKSAMFYKNARIFTSDFRFVTGAFEVKDGLFGAVLPENVPDDAMRFRPS